MKKKFSHLRSFLWLRSCLLSFEEVRKDHWHPGWTQTYGLTPVWTRSWAISLEWILNSLSQVEHCKRAFSIALKLEIFLIIVNYSFWKYKSSLRWESYFEIFYSITNIETGRQNLQLTNVCSTTIFSQFFANYINIFHKTEVQTVILRCLIGLNCNWFKIYATKHKYLCFQIFAIL